VPIRDSTGEAHRFLHARRLQPRFAKAFLLASFHADYERHARPQQGGIVAWDGLLLDSLAAI